MSPYRIPLLPGYRMAVLKAQFGERVAAPLLVDTGSSRTIVVPDLAQRLGLDVGHPLATMRLYGVGGDQHAVVCQVDLLSIGAIVLRQHEVVVADLPEILRVDGLIGLDVLSRFRVTFEFDKRTLVLRTPFAA